MVKSGLEVLLDMGCSPLRGKRVGLIMNQASIDRYLNYGVNLLLEAGIDM